MRQKGNDWAQELENKTSEERFLDMQLLHVILTGSKKDKKYKSFWKKRYHWKILSTACTTLHNWSPKQAVTAAGRELATAGTSGAPHRACTAPGTHTGRTQLMLSPLCCLALGPSPELPEPDQCSRRKPKVCKALLDSYVMLTIYTMWKYTQSSSQSKLFKKN